jgi:hypothetical protein
LVSTASVIGSSWAQSLALCVTSCATMICASALTAIWALYASTKPSLLFMIRLVWAFFVKGHHAIFCRPFSFHSFV